MAVIGAGSWGTALAIQLSRAGHPTHLWGRDAAQLDAMRRARCNERYLPDAAFPPALEVAADLRHALHGVRDALIAVPSHAFRPTLGEVAAHLGAGTRVAWATKGFEIPSGLLPHQVAGEVLGARPGAVLSGPTFAKEVGAGLPTAMTVASHDPEFAKALASRLSGPHFRAYIHNDIMGVEVGGAVKNVIAIGSGIADGMGFGANTRVALITRGPRGNAAPGSQAGRGARDFHGSCRSRRSGAHLHRRSIAQPPSRAGTGPRPLARGRAGRHTSSDRGRAGVAGGRVRRRRQTGRRHADLPGNFPDHARGQTACARRFRI